MALPVHRPATSGFLSTGKAARLLSVTPDTVLKWIKAGRLPAVQTAGGHYRVAKADVERLAGPGTAPRLPGEPGFYYCWEYYAKDGVAGPGCRECLVYRARARRCYEMSGLARESGFTGAFCEGSCETCTYFREIVMARRKVLVVTTSEALRRRLAGESEGSRLELAFAAGEYECSAAIDRFRPDLVLLDGTLPRAKRSSLCANLAADARLQGVEILLAAEGAESAPREARTGVDGALPRTFSLRELEQHLIGVGVKPVATA